MERKDNDAYIYHSSTSTADSITTTTTAHAPGTVAPCFLILVLCSSEIHFRVKPLS